MKKVKLLLALFILTAFRIASAQAPQGMNYQAIARDAGGNQLPNQNICVQSTITDVTGSTTYYQETFNITTNQFGLFTLKIGGGTPVSGTFSAISWSSITPYQKVEIKIGCAGSYVLMGSSQLLSVPYALNALSSNSSGSVSGTTNYVSKFTGSSSIGNSQIYDTTTGVGIGTTSPQALLHILKPNSASVSPLQIGNLNQPAKEWIFDVDGLANLSIKNEGNGTPFLAMHIQNVSGRVGIGTTSSLGKLHVLGTENISQLLLQGNATQSNTNPLIRFQNAAGFDLMWINSDNSLNTFVGMGAGSVNDAAGNGIFNTFIGSSAGVANTTGQSNTAVGRNALTSTNTGSGNTGVGLSALYSNTIGASNTAYGTNALYSSTTGNLNTAIGYNALYSNVAGYNGTAVGNGAMRYSNSLATLFVNTNVAFGFESLRGSATAADNTGNNNTSIGYQTLWSNTTGSGNTANGIQALYTNNTGSSNTANGQTALFSNTTGYSNTANGSYALYTNADGYQNTATGSNALHDNGSGYYNTATGYNSLYFNTTGYHNSAGGYFSLYFNTVGFQNVALGSNALKSNVAGNYATAIGNAAMYYANDSPTPLDNYNVAVGYNALRGSTTASSNTGVNNTALGANALWSTTSGVSNTATGKLALGANNAGAYNTSNGFESLRLNTTGNDNTANGTSALYSNTTGSANTAIGENALYYNAAGNNATAIGYNAMRYANSSTSSFPNSNIAIGYEALRGSVSAGTNTGNANTAIGYQSLWSNTGGSSNTISGYQAGYTNTSGNANSFYGWHAGYLSASANDNSIYGYDAGSKTTGGENAFFGSYAGNAVTTGTQNTYIGRMADGSVTTLTNSTAIGYNTKVDASNKARMGNSSVISNGGQVSWTAYSDGRVKTDVKENVPGLDFIKALRPVTFHYNVDKENELLGIKDITTWEGKYDIEKIAFTGFIAQEVDAAAKKAGYDFSGVDKSGSVLGIRYSDFVMPLVKGMQEQQQQIEELKKQNSLQVQSITELKTMVDKLMQQAQAQKTTTSR